MWIIVTRTSPLNTKYRLQCIMYYTNNYSNIQSAIKYLNI